MLTMPELFAEHLITPKRLAEMREQANQEIIRRLASGARIPDDLPEKLRDQLPKVPEGYIPPAKSSYELESERVAAAATAAQAAAAAEAAAAEAARANTELPNLNSEISDPNAQPSAAATSHPEISAPNAQQSDTTDSPSETSSLNPQPSDAPSPSSESSALDAQISDPSSSPSEISNLKSQISDEAPAQPPSPPH
jgi:type II secretory pathway pseudopilin PulG